MAKALCACDIVTDAYDHLTALIRSACPIRNVTECQARSLAEAANTTHRARLVTWARATRAATIER